MTIPFVIDNQQHKMAGVLNDLLAQHKGHSLDVATAYFNVGGCQLLREGINGLGNFRLLLGDEPEAGSDLGLREIGAKPVKGLILDLAHESFNEQTLRLVEDPIAFLHAKGYLFYSGGGFERFSPVAAIVASSNFTRPGLLTNKELNLAHRANLSPAEVGPEQVKGLLESEERKRLAALGDLERVTAANVPGVLAINELSAWYERQWEAARDFKEALIDLLDASKFGRKAYTPYHVYMKAIFEYFRDDLDTAEDGAASTRSVVELSEFQPDTRRIVPVDGEVDIFALQEKVIASIVQSSVEQVAVEEAPKQLDPIQQTIATILRGYINSPAVSRKDVISAIQQLNQPLPGVYIKELRKAHESFSASGQVHELLAAVQGISQATVELVHTESESKAPVRREDLKLVCFDYLWL